MNTVIDTLNLTSYASGHANSLESTALIHTDTTTTQNMNNASHQSQYGAVVRLPEFVEFLNSDMCGEWTNYHLATLEKNSLIYLISIGFACVNIVTNMFAYFIFSKAQKQGKNILNSLLRSLSLCEVIFQILFIIYCVIEHRLLQGRLVFESLGGLQHALGAYLVGVIPLLSASHIARNWFIVVVSLYRFEVVCRAMATKFLLFQERRIPYIVAFVSIAAVIISIPRVIERHNFVCISTNSLSNTSDSEEMTSYKVIGLGAWYSMLPVYRYTYTLVILFMLQTGGPTLVVCTCSCLIVVKLANREKMRAFLRNGGTTTQSSTAAPSSTTLKTTLFSPKSSTRTDPTKLSPHKRAISTISNTHSASNSQSSRGGRLVIALSFCFFCLEMPAFFSKTLNAFSLLHMETSEILGNVANFATLLDSTVNFFIYLLSNRQFRETMLAFFGMKKTTRRSTCCQMVPVSRNSPAICREKTHNNNDFSEPLLSSSSKLEDNKESPSNV